MPDQIAPREGTSEAARAEIERTRARISETIDEIEVTLLRKRKQLRNRFDVLGRLRDSPLRAAAVVLGAGVVVGFLTGGGKKVKPDTASQERAARWEGRARRLLALAREQEENIEDLEAALDDLSESSALLLSEAEDDLEDEGHSRLSDIRAAATSRISELADRSTSQLWAVLNRRR